MSLREYDSAAYPTQLLFPNEFKINIINSHIDYDGALAGTAVNDYDLFAATAPQGSQAAFLIANPPFYQASPAEVSHFFCGDSRIEITTGTAPPPAIRVPASR